MWKVIARSVIGTSHQQLNLPCQDYGRYLLLDGEILIGAVSDGAGSAKYAEIGSKNTVEESLRFLQASQDNSDQKLLSQEILTEELTQALFSQLVESVRSRLTNVASEIEGNLSDLASTLLVFIATPYWLAAMQIGDGFMVIRGGNEKYRLLFQPDKGEYINETTFVTSDHALESMQVKVLSELPSFICVATDGVERVSLNLVQWMPFSPFFQPLEDYLRETDNPEQDDEYLMAFLNSERLNARTTDDKTLLLSLWSGDRASSC